MHALADVTPIGGGGRCVRAPAATPRTRRAIPVPGVRCPPPRRPAAVAAPTEPRREPPRQPGRSRPAHRTGCTASTASTCRTCWSRRSSCSSRSSGCSRSSSTAWSRCGTGGCDDPTRDRLGRLRQLRPSCSPTSDFWNALVNTFGIFMLSTVPQLLLALVHREPAQPQAAGADLVAGRRAAAVRDPGGRVDAGLRGGLRPGQRHGQLGAVAGRHRRPATPHRLAGRSTGQCASWCPGSRSPRWSTGSGSATTRCSTCPRCSPSRKDIYEAAAVDGAGPVAAAVADHRADDPAGGHLHGGPVRPSAACSCSPSRCCSTRTRSRPAAAPTDEWQTIAQLIYKVGWKDLNLGYAAAMSWALFLIIVIVAVVNALIDQPAGRRTQMTTTDAPATAPTQRREAARARPPDGAGPAGHPGGTCGHYLLLSLMFLFVGVPAVLDVRHRHRAPTRRWPQIPPKVMPGQPSSLNEPAARSSTHSQDVYFPPSLINSVDRRPRGHRVGAVLLLAGRVRLRQAAVQGPQRADGDRHPHPDRAQPARRRRALHRDGQARAGTAPCSRSSCPAWSPRSACSTCDSSSIEAVPDELVESARVDGASTMRMYWSIVLPAIRPALAVLGLLTFVGHLERLPVAAASP